MSVKSPRQREEVCPLAPSTKLALASSLKRLLQKKFLDDITVKEIVEDCEVNRQTFYYHFQDIYDLLHWFLDHETVQVVQDCPSWQEALMAVFRYIQENHMIIYHIYRSGGRDHLDCQFFTMSRALVVLLLENASDGLSISQRDREFLVDKSGADYRWKPLGLVNRWKDFLTQTKNRITYLQMEARERDRNQKGKK